MRHNKTDKTDKPRDADRTCGKKRCYGCHGEADFLDRKAKPARRLIAKREDGECLASADGKDKP